MSRLAADGLNKSYRHQAVVDEVSVEVTGGEIVGLLGPNGAGKTTTFYMIAGLIPCDRGAITLDDREITGMPMHLRARAGIGYLPQEPSVFRKLSVAENLLAILETRRDLDKRERRQQCDRLLEDLNIAHLRNAKGMSLSGGERRRAEIARALAVEPRFMLLDEPFAGVDPISVSDIQDIIGYLAKRGIGILITDHNVRETLSICQRAYIMNEGRVIAQGDPQSILANQTVRDVYLGHAFRA